MTKWKALGMNTGFGKKQYALFFHDGVDWRASYPSRYYKTKEGAERAIKKKV